MEATEQHPTTTPASTRARIARLREMLEQATPGDWTADQDMKWTIEGGEPTEWVGDLEVQSNDGDSYVCDVYGIDHSKARPYYQKEFTKEAWANARIIENARAVLERALAAAEAAMAEYEQHASLTNNYWAKLALEQAYAALRIALGPSVKENDDATG